MGDQTIFEFTTDISNIEIPPTLNNPFEVSVAKISKIAANEFQDYITTESKQWKYDFRARQGKMFGVLVVRKKDSSLGFLGTVSGKLPGNSKPEKFTPSVFDESVGNYFINRGMTELTEIGTQIKNSIDASEIDFLKEKRRQKSIGLQQRLFENYNFFNLSGQEHNILDIFKNASQGKPPAAAGECAAPKLLQYAIKNELKPIALAEFWWGNPIKTEERKHKSFYPACKNKCRPILEYMLENNELFETAQKKH